MGFSKRKQRTRIGNLYSTCFGIVLGVPQKSILEPVLFNIFVADLFFDLKDVDIANFANDSTPHTSKKYADEF